MSERKEALLGQMLLAVGRGAGETRLSNEAVAWLYDRYFPWLDEEGPDGDTPLKVWDEQGEGFLNQFTEIGRRIAAASQPPGSKAGPATVASAAAGVESESECPYCPKTPIPS